MMPHPKCLDGADSFSQSISSHLAVQHSSRNDLGQSLIHPRFLFSQLAYCRNAVMRLCIAIVGSRAVDIRIVCQQPVCLRRSTSIYAGPQGFVPLKGHYKAERTLFTVQRRRVLQVLILWCPHIERPDQQCTGCRLGKQIAAGRKLRTEPAAAV